METNPEKEPEPDPEPKPEPAPEAAPEKPAPKRRGRPEGAKDRAPRKKKQVVVVEEHITQEPQEDVAQEKNIAPETPPQSPKKEAPRARQSSDLDSRCGRTHFEVEECHEDGSQNASPGGLH